MVPKSVSGVTGTQVKNFSPTFFTEIEKKKNPKICMELKKMPNSQNNPEQKQQSWHHTTFLQNLLQSYSDQNSMELA